MRIIFSEFMDQDARDVVQVYLTIGEVETLKWSPQGDACSFVSNRSIVDIRADMLEAFNPAEFTIKL